MKPYYENDNGVLYHGDCLEILPQLGPVGCCVTDPPYGCTATTGRGGKYNGFSIIGDSDTKVRDALLKKISCPAAIFGSPRKQRPEHKALLIWNKGQHTGMGDLAFPWKPDFEEIYIIGDGWSGRRTTSVLSFNARTDSGRLHPTEKPVTLMIEIIGKAPKGTILDPFLGSGTTAVACERLNRKWIGIEISEEYCEIAAKRIDAENRQLKLF